LEHEALIDLAASCRQNDWGLSHYLSKRPCTSQRGIVESNYFCTTEEYAARFDHDLNSRYLVWWIPAFTRWDGGCTVRPLDLPLRVFLCPASNTWITCGLL